MSESIEEAGGTGPSHRGVELGVAGAIALLALIGIYGSLKNGVGWASDGPQAGFFPFYVCLIILISCAVNIAQVLMAGSDFLKRSRCAWWNWRQARVRSLS